MSITIVSNNVVPMGVKPNIDAPKPLTTAERLYAMAKKAELEPDKYKYMLAMTASCDLAGTEWMIAGHPSHLMVLGLLEIAKEEVGSFFSLAAREMP